MNIELAIKEISKLDALSDKLKYYNDNVSSLIGIDNFDHEVGFGIGKEQYKIFCLCERCNGKYSISDFETYRDIRNQETQKVVDFFESTNDYKTKIEYYFKISEGFSTTRRTLFFVPDNLDDIDNVKYPYKISTIDITPKDTTEIAILKNHLKQKILTTNSQVSIPLAQFTFEKRVENIEKYLKIRIEKSRREELLQLEYDKINLLKVDRSSQKAYDTTLYRILKVADDIIQEKHNEFYTEFRKIEVTILAEDTIKYEKYLNNLSLPLPEQQAHLSNQERNIIKLNQYYNCIWNVRLFKENIIKRGDELYYHDRTKSFIENREKDLAENVILNIRSGWLTPFNRSLKRFMDQVVSCFKLVVEWKDNNSEIHENGIEIRLHLAMEFFRELPKSVRLNYDSNNDFLVFKMREYYINGFQMMFDFLKSELMIDLENSPFYPKIQKVIDDVKNAVDIESLKLSLNYQAAKNVNQNLSSDSDVSVDKEVNKERLSQTKIPLKELDFNLENLFDLGLTSEILKNNFEEWIRDNEDILIDFKNQKIYAGIINAKKEMANMLEKIAISMKNNGMSQDQVEEFLISEKQKSNILLKEKCNQLPEELAYDFNLKLILKTFERYEELKEKHFDSMMDEILKVDSSSFLVNNEKASSELQLENNENQNQVNTNPYPRIFTSPKAYNKFVKLHEEFGNSKENLANYSFVYHRMLKDNLIYSDYKKTEFVFFLLKFEINIDRIKSENQLGKTDLRESIYNKY